MKVLLIPFAPCVALGVILLLQVIEDWATDDPITQVRDRTPLRVEDDASIPVRTA